jgi:hypothetical protein
MILGGLAAIGAARFFHWRRHGGWGCGRGRRRWHSHWGGHGPWGHHGPWGGGYGQDEYGPDFGGERGPDDGWGGRDHRVSFVVRFLSERLEASPAQERVIASSLEEFRAEVAGLKGEAPKTREDIAAALRKSSFDEVMMGELFARHDTAIEKTRKAFVGMVAKIHDALDERQRERLATIVERGPRFFSPRWGW